MLEFFATSGDFTRRLTSIRANPKFSTPLAGPEDFYSVSQTAYLSEKPQLWQIVLSAFGKGHAATYTI